MLVELHDYSITDLIITPQTDFERNWLDNMFENRAYEKEKFFTARRIDHGSIKSTKGLLIQQKKEKADG